MILEYSDLEFSLSPQRRFWWPPLNRGPILRGALGWVLREAFCDPRCADPQHCRFGGQCAYRTLFAPVAPPGADRLSLNRDRPRPFVIIAGDEPGREVPAGGAIAFKVRLFGSAIGLYPYVAEVFDETCRLGLGPDRTRMRMLSVTAEGAPVDLSRPAPIRVNQVPLDLDDTGEPADLLVRFETPTHLKHDGRDARNGREALAALACRVRDRVSALYHFHSVESGELPPLAWDFRGLGEEARPVRCLRDRTRWLGQRRRSSRTGQTHDLSGLVGEALYQSVPARTRRLLQIGTVVHAGKHAAFGLGRFSLGAR